MTDVDPEAPVEPAPDVAPVEEPAPVADPNAEYVVSVPESPRLPPGEPVSELPGYADVE